MGCGQPSGKGRSWVRRGKICHASVQVGVVLRFAESHRSAVENLQGPGKTSCLFPEREREICDLLFVPLTLFTQGRSCVQWMCLGVVLHHALAQWVCALHDGTAVFNLLLLRVQTTNKTMLYYKNTLKNHQLKHPPTQEML